MAVVLIVFTWYSQPTAEQIQAQRESDSIAASRRIEAQQAEEARIKAAEAQALLMKQDSTSLLFSARNGSSQLITLENDNVRLTINTHGGVIETAELKNYQDQQKQNVRLVNPDDAHMRLSLPTKTDNIITDELYFQVADMPASGAGESLQSVTLRLPLATGSLEIDYTLRPDAYMVDMVVRANGIANLFMPSTQALTIDWNDRAHQLEKGFDFEQRYSCIRYHSNDGTTDNLSETSDDEEEIEQALDWVAFKNQFFSAALISQQQFTGAHLTSRLYQKGQGYLKSYEAQLQTAFDPTGARPTQLQLYFGPNDFHTLKAHNDLSLNADRDLELEDLVYLGWPVVRWINRWFIICTWGSCSSY